LTRNRTILLTLAATLCLWTTGCDRMGLARSSDEEPKISVDAAFIDARTTLLQAAVSNDPMTRTYAMEGIGKRLGAAEAGTLMQGLDDKAVTVRFAAAMSLGDLAYPPAEGRMEQFILNPATDQRVVCAAIYCLYRLGNSKYASQLGAILNSDFKFGRATAAMVMGKMGETSAIKPLQSLLADEQDPTVRLNTIEALARLGDQHSLRMLESYAKGYYLDMRLAAIPTIAELRPPSTDRLLHSLLSSDNPPRVRVTAAGGLGTIGQADDDAYDMCLAAAAFPLKFYQASYGEDKTFKPYEISSLQRLAALSLGHIRRRSAMDRLHSLLESPEGGVRVATAMALLEIISRKPAAPRPGPAARPTNTTPQARPKLHSAGARD
jgi:HEAT repeat protein